MGRTLSESDALALLDQKLQGCDRWSFYYFYQALEVLNQTVHFSVAFGPDGRVTEIRGIGDIDRSFIVAFGPDGRFSDVKPVYGWD